MEGGTNLYEETKLVLSKINEISSDDNHVIKTRDNTEEAIEQILDILKLDLQPEVITYKNINESIEVITSTPLVKYLGEFSMELSNNDDEPSPIQLQVLYNRSIFIASLPDRLANALLKTSIGFKKLEIDVDLFINRICQALCLFLLALYESPLEEDSKIHINKNKYLFKKVNALIVSETMIQAIIRRGYIKTFFQSFTYLLKSIKFNLFITEEIIPFVFKVIYKSNFKNKIYELPKENLKNNELIIKEKKNLYWSQWNMWFLQMAQKDFEFKKILLLSLIYMMKFNKENEEFKNENFYICKALEREIFITETSSIPIERGILRLIFREILPAILLTHNKGKESKELSKFEENIFLEIFQKWGNRDIVEKGSYELNSTLANSILYIMIHIKENNIKYENNKLPHILLQPLLSGVTARFEIIRSTEIRNEGIIVASAFASFFVDDKEALNAFSNLEEFPLLLNNWLKNEINPMEVSSLLTEVTEKKTQNIFNDIDNNDMNTMFFRKCLEEEEDEEYPLNPDDAFNFFTKKDSNKIKKSNLFNSETVILNQENIINHENLLSFGKTKYEKDELEDNITILNTLRESYNAIMGIGRSNNSQLYEVQQAIESGLRGFYRSLEKLKKKLSIWKEQIVDGELLRSREKIGRELNPMISSLLPSLMSINIHAPEEKLKELMNLRYLNMVSLIIIVPENSLNQLCKMIYSSHYGIFQRVEMAKAIGEAAKYLSKIEVNLKSKENSNFYNKEITKDNNRKRIYPPIRNEIIKSQSIIITEGKETRRWGNAISERVERKNKIYTSYLTEVVNYFISALLVRAENDHFTFFHDKDPYVPAEILRSICIIVQSITSSRHIVSNICENLISFAIAVVTQHPISIVRRQGWILIGEIMRCWCGASPLIVNEEYSSSSFLSRNVFGGTLSYIFSDEWLKTQQALEILFEKIKEDSTCVDAACLVLRDLQDLILAKRDVETMENRIMSNKKISITAITE